MIYKFIILSIVYSFLGVVIHNSQAQKIAIEEKNQQVYNISLYDLQKNSKQWIAEGEMPFYNRKLHQLIFFSAKNEMKTYDSFYVYDMSSKKLKGYHLQNICFATFVSSNTIVFEQYNNTAYKNYLILFNTQTLHTDTLTSEIRNPFFDKKNNCIFYAHKNQIFTYHVKTKSIRKYSQNKGDKIERFPTISPNGKWIAYYTQDKKTDKIFFTIENISTHKMLCEVPYIGDKLTWIDNERILFLQENGNTTNAYIYYITTKKIKALKQDFSNVKWVD